MEFIVTGNARKHGVADDDMFHAIRNVIRIYEQDDDMRMHIGPSQSGALLEVGTVDASDHSGLMLVVHAMPARPKYLNR